MGNVTCYSSFGVKVIGKLQKKSKAECSRVYQESWLNFAGVPILFTEIGAQQILRLVAKEFHITVGESDGYLDSDTTFWKT